MKKVLKNEGRVLELLCFGMPDCNGKCCLALSEQEKFQFCSLTKMNPLNKSIIERKGINSIKRFKYLINASIVQNVLDSMAFEEDTTIQVEIIKKGQAGKDIIGQAQKGTGKTVAFVIPMIDQYDTQTKAVQGL